VAYYNNSKILLNNGQEERVASKTQGSRSVTYRDSASQFSTAVTIPEYIKAMLPMPKIKVVG